MEQTLRDLLGLPEPDQLVVFEHTPLVLALCQIKFTRVLGVADTVFVAPFQRAIQEQYPIAKQAQDVGLQVTAGPGIAQIQQERRSYRWEFSDQEDNWKVVLAEESLGIETRAYDSFSDFLGRLRRALDAVVEHIHPNLITRIGLRYINEIRLGSMAAADLVNPELLGPLGVPALAPCIQQSMQQLLLRYPSISCGVNIHHGLFQEGTTVRPRQGQEPVSGPFYLLDLDAFREFQLPGGLSVDVDMICNEAESYNRAIYRLFRWSIRPGYTSQLGVRRYASS